MLKLPRRPIASIASAALLALVAGCSGETETTVPATVRRVVDHSCSEGLGPDGRGGQRCTGAREILATGETRFLCGVLRIEDDRGQYPIGSRVTVVVAKAWTWFGLRTEERLDRLATGEPLRVPCSDD